MIAEVRVDNAIDFIVQFSPYMGVEQEGGITRSHAIELIAVWARTGDASRIPLPKLYLATRRFDPINALPEANLANFRTIVNLNGVEYICKRRVTEPATTHSVTWTPWVNNRDVRAAFGSAGLVRYRGIGDTFAGVLNPAAGDVIYSTHYGWFEYQVSSPLNPTAAVHISGPLKWLQQFRTQEEANHNVSELGQVAYFDGAVREVTNFVAGAPTDYAYYWHIYEAEDGEVTKGLQDAIDAEEAARIAADNALRDSIPEKALNTDIDAETDDVKYTTVEKVYRAIGRKVKNATNQIFGLVKLARNQDVDSSETDTDRVPNVAKAKRLILRLISAAFPPAPAGAATTKNYLLRITPTGIKSWFEYVAPTGSGSGSLSAADQAKLDARTTNPQAEGAAQTEPYILTGAYSTLAYDAAAWNANNLAVGRVMVKVEAGENTRLKIHLQDADEELVPMLTKAEEAGSNIRVSRADNQTVLLSGILEADHSRTNNVREWIFNSEIAYNAGNGISLALQLQSTIDAAFRGQAQAVAEAVAAVAGKANQAELDAAETRIEALEDAPHPPRFRTLPAPLPPLHSRFVLTENDYQPDPNGDHEARFIPQSLGAQHSGFNLTPQVGILPPQSNAAGIAAIPVDTCLGLTRVAAIWQIDTPNNANRGRIFLAIDQATPGALVDGLYGPNIVHLYGAGEDVSLYMEEVGAGVTVVSGGRTYRIKQSTVTAHAALFEAAESNGASIRVVMEWPALDRGSDIERQYLHADGVRGGTLVPAGAYQIGENQALIPDEMDEIDTRLDALEASPPGSGASKALNADVDAVGVTDTDLDAIGSTARAGLDDTKFLTTRKGARLLSRVLKKASTTVLGLVLSARNADVDATETDTTRHPDVARVIRLLNRLRPTNRQLPAPTNNAGDAGKVAKLNAAASVWEIGDDNAGAAGNLPNAPAAAATDKRYELQVTAAGVRTWEAAVAGGSVTEAQFLEHTRFETIDTGVITFLGFNKFASTNLGATAIQDAVRSGPHNSLNLGGVLFPDGSYGFLDSYLRVDRRFYTVPVPAAGCTIVLADLATVRNAADAAAIDGARFMIKNTGTGTMRFVIGGIGRVHPTGNVRIPPNGVALLVIDAVGAYADIGTANPAYILTVVALGIPPSLPYVIPSLFPAGLANRAAVTAGTAFHVVLNGIDAQRLAIAGSLRVMIGGSAAADIDWTASAGPHIIACSIDAGRAQVILAASAAAQFAYPIKVEFYNGPRSQAGRAKFAEETVHLGVGYQQLT